MIKKSLIFILLFSLIALATLPVFATNITSDAENTLNGIRDGFQNMVNDTGNSVERAKDGIGNVINDGKNHIENGARDLGNGLENITNDVDENSNSESMESGTNNEGIAGTTDGYTASRTSATDTINTSNTTIWTVLAIVGIVIVALVWYYGSQVQNNRDNY